MAEFCLDGTNKSLSKSRESQIYSLFQRSWGAQKNRTPHHDIHYMDIILISLSFAWRASSTKDEERLNLYRMHFSSKCLKKDQHNDVVRPFYHFRPSCDVIIMETWHILTCALSTQDWTKCYIGMFLMYSVFTTNIYRWKGKIIISNILGFLYNVFRLWPLDQVSGWQPKSGCPIWAQVSVLPKSTHDTRSVHRGFLWLSHLCQKMRGLL